MIVHLNNVSLNLPGANRNIIHQMNYQIHQGDFVILLGSNGSGKSSLLKLLHRHYQANTGDIHLFGKPIAHHSNQEFSEQVAVLTQNPADSLFISLTIYENYLLANNSKNRSLSRSFLQKYLADFNPNLAKKLDLTIEQLSGGEKQALALAFCLLQPPSLLLLDEHTSALDPKTSDQIMQLTQQKIAEHHITCILTTHDLDIAMRYGNRILLLRDGQIGQIFDKDEKRLLSKEHLISHYY